MNFVTRIAPSPTGLFHMGTARTAYFNWLLARASGGRFILRIDDTDAARNDDSFIKVILDAMDWLGLDYDTIFRQSDRYLAHDDVAHRLIAAGLCTADHSDIGTAYRLNLPPDALPATWTDEIAGTIKVTDNDRKNVSSLVLLRSDGAPTYHFASIVDDLACGVNYIVRGNDHLNNTIKQIAIVEAMKLAGLYDGDLPKFAHLGLIQVVNADGKRVKLSKRDASASLLGFRDAGCSPAAMLNFLLRLGWSPTDANFDKTTKMVPKDDAVKLFLTAGRMRNSPVLFDPVFLNTLDRRYKAVEPA